MICNKNFHQNCSRLWNIKACPACCCINNPGLIKNSVCMKCGTEDELWLCLTCGHVGCSRSKNSHALEHYEETCHTYAMNINAFIVWHYHKDEYVHGNQLSDFFVLNKNNSNHKEHSFDCECQVCQFLNVPKIKRQPICMLCEAEFLELLLCLSCGYLGCASHSDVHYKTSQHKWAVHINNLRFWNHEEYKYLRQLPESVAFVFKQKVNWSEQEHLKQTMEIIEKQSLQCLKLSEANDKMIEIERRLEDLCKQKQELENKFQLHDDRLNDLLQQFKMFEKSKMSNEVTTTTQSIENEKIDNNNEMIDNNNEKIDNTNEKIDQNNEKNLSDTFVVKEDAYTADIQPSNYLQFSIENVQQEFSGFVLILILLFFHFVSMITN